MFTVLALYPIIERKLTKDETSHHLLQRPRDVPVRTALGAMALTFYMWLLLAAENAEPRQRVRTGKLLNFTGASMSPEQVEEARQLARRCMDNKYKGC